MTQLKRFPKMLKKYAKTKVYQIGLAPIRILPHGSSSAMCMMAEMRPLTPENIIAGFAQGLIGAPDMETQTMKWFDPNPRTIVPIDELHVSRSLKRAMRKIDYEVTIDKDFKGVIEGCANRPQTWLLPELIDIYTDLHERGAIHSTEVWQDGQLAGGVFGLQIGGFYAGISQFHAVPDAGKIALVYLCEILKVNGFELLDSGWNSPYLEQFGCQDIPRDEFHKRFANAIVKTPKLEMIDYKLFEKD